MPFRIASVLGAYCLSWQALLVLGEEEHFPLSGGFDNGVQVTIKVTAIADSDAKIEFLSHEKKIAFSFSVNKTAQTITRSSAPEFSAVSESFGGWPAGLGTGGATFVFTKRRFHMAVTIDGVRYPWYDFTHQKQGDTFPLLTHASVFSGLLNPVVTLWRPACSHQCHPNECLDASGNSVCEGPDGTGCFSVVMGDTAGLAAKCTTDKMNARGDMHCCDGVDVTPKARSPLAISKYAVLSSSEAYLTRLCAAFSLAACPSAYAGSKARVESINASMQLYTVFVPAAISSRTKREDDHALPATAFYDLPAFALFESFTIQKAVATIGHFTDAIFDADPFWDIIVTSDASRGAPEELKDGWYMHLISWNMYYDRTTKYTLKARQLFRARGGTVYASDEPVALPATCRDLKFEDEYGDNCDAYRGTGVCTIHGYSTPQGCKKWKNQDPGCPLPSGEDYEVSPPKPLGSNAAGLMCCDCGGGQHDAPSNWGPSSSFQLDEL